MKSDSNSPDLNPAQDRLADSLLAEHARLGTGRDEELVANVLLKTVAVESNVTRFSPAPKESVGLADWAKIAAAVVVIASLGALLLNQFSSGNNLVKKEQRQEETFHLVVDYIETTTGADVENKADRKVLVTAQPGTNRFLPVNPGIAPVATPAVSGDVDLAPPETTFAMSIDEFPEVSSSFKLASNDTTSTGGKVIYSGEVVLDHDSFVLTADSLVMDRSAGEVPVLKALNATLSHRDGSYETEADAISFDPSNGELVARGVHRLISKGIEQTMVNRAAVVVFEGDDFFIEEGFARPF